MPKTEQTPKMALLLGWGGVIPFIATALLKVFGGPVLDLYALVWGTTYAGVIIVFIGAVHWGIAVQHPNERQRVTSLFWSVLPALAVWPVLTLPPIVSLPFMIIGLGIVWAVDMFAYKRGYLPRWYIKLRHGLTSVAMLSLLTIAFA